MAQWKVFIPVMLAVAAFSSVTFTLGDPGISWDECIYLGFDVRYVNWLGCTISGAALPPELSGLWVKDAWHDHPPLAMFWMGAFIEAFKGWFGYTVYGARLGVAVAFAALVVAVYALGCWARGMRAGVLSAIVLMLLPRIFAHAHFGTLEIFTSLVWVLTTLCFIRGLGSKKWAGVTGILLGLAFLTKIQLVLLPIGLALWGVIYYGRKVIPNLIAMAVIAPVVFVLGWPWLCVDPLDRLLRLIHDLTQRAPVPLYYLGRVYNQEGYPRAPWHYPLVMTMVTVPVGLLVAFIWQLGSAMRNRLKSPFMGLAAINVGLLLVVSSLPGVPKYDGVRLFLPLFIFVACLAGVGLDRLWDGMEKRLNRRKAAIVLVVLMLMQAVPVVITHPFGLGYYNGLVGGVWGARKLGFETLYWGESVDRKVLDFINQNASAGSRVLFYQVGGFVPGYLKRWGLLKETLSVVEKPKDALARGDYDIAVLVARYSYLKQSPEAWRLFHEEEPLFVRSMLGVPVCKVFAHTSS